MTDVSSMSLRSFDRLADRIHLHRQSDQRPILIVEGVTDEKFLRNEYGTVWHYFSAAGRVNALEAIDQLVRQGNANSVVCLVDRDFDDTVSKIEKRRPVVSYRNADLEGMLATEEVLSIVLDNLGSPEKLNQRESVRVVLTELSEMVAPVSRLRRAACVNSWALPFDEVEPAASIENRTLKFSIRGYCTSLRGMALKNGDSVPPLQALIDIAEGKERIDMPKCPHGAVRYFSGKDFAAMLGVALRRKYGDLAQVQAGRDHMASVLRMTASGRIKRTEWGAKLEALMA